MSFFSFITKFDQHWYIIRTGIIETIKCKESAYGVSKTYCQRQTQVSSTKMSWGDINNNKWQISFKYDEGRNQSVATIINASWHSSTSFDNLLTEYPDS